VEAKYGGYRRTAGGIKGSRSYLLRSILSPANTAVGALGREVSATLVRNGAQGKRAGGAKPGREKEGRMTSLAAFRVSGGGRDRAGPGGRGGRGGTEGGEVCAWM
jgi:hypothetical protein